MGLQYSSSNFNWRRGVSSSPFGGLVVWCFKTFQGGNMHWMGKFQLEEHGKKHTHKVVVVEPDSSFAQFHVRCVPTQMWPFSTSFTQPITFRAYWPRVARRVHPPRPLLHRCAAANPQRSSPESKSLGQESAVCILPSRISSRIKVRVGATS